MKCDTIPDLERFLAIQEQTLGTASPEVATTLAKLARMYADSKRYRDAENLYRRAIEIRAHAKGVHRNGLADCEEALAKVLAFMNGDRILESTPIAANKFGADSASQKDLKKVSGDIRNSSNKPAYASDWTNMAPSADVDTSEKLPANVDVGEVEFELKVLKQMVGERHPSVADCLTKLADLYCRNNMIEKMEPVLLEALAVREKSRGPEHVSVSTSLKNLARLYTEQGRSDEAEKLLRRALGIRERSLGLVHSRTLDVVRLLIFLLKKQGRNCEAHDLEDHYLLPTG